MRKLMATAIVILFAGATSSWALFGLEDVSYDGSLEVSGVAANNETDQDDAAATSDRNGGVNTRVIVGVNAMVTEGVKGRLEFTRTGEQYGSQTSGAGDGTNANSLHGETARIAVQNAYVSIEDVIFGVGAILGRQYVGEAGDLVWNIAPTDNDRYTVNAIDGLTLMRGWEHVNANLFMGKATEDDSQTAIAAGGGDVNLNSLDLTNETLVPNGKINVGYLWGVDENTSAASDSNKLTTLRVGVKGGVSENMFTYRAEYLKNGGEDKGTNIPAGQTKVSYGGSAIDLGVGLNAPESSAGKFSLRAGMINASGDDKAGDGDDDSFHDFGILGVGTSDRIMGEIFGKSAMFGNASAVAGNGGGVETGAQGPGMQVLNFGVTYTPPCMDGKLSANVDYWKFDTNEDGNNSNQPMQDEYGDEIDLVFNYAHSDNVGVDFGYAMFSPGKAVVGTAASAKDDDITKLFARTKIKWGGDAE